jgi:hypothetical protein
MLEERLMKKLPIFIVAGVAAALAGTAIAAAPRTHVINVPLPDGSVARVEYVGDVAPKVTVAPPTAPGGFWATGAMAPFSNFDGMFEKMSRQMGQIEQMARQPVGAPGMNVAAYGNLPAGANSVSVVTVSNGGSSCTRTTQVVSQGAGKPPKVTTNQAGNCAGVAQPAQPAPPSPPPGPLDHT